MIPVHRFQPLCARCQSIIPAVRAALIAITIGSGLPASVHADSINSPNITLNVDTNRATGAGAGDVAVTINTITIAEINVNEYAATEGSRITLGVQPGFQFDPASNVTAQSATIGFNGGGINAVAVLTPAGTANEVLTFNLTSGTSGGQDIIRINGIRLKILDAAGAAGPAQITMFITTSAAGGAFTSQGIVSATITKGAPDRLVFSTQPGSNQAGADLLPAVSIVDFGGNIITNDPRIITLAIQSNPGAATLLGITGLETDNGVAAWEDGDDLRIATAATGYTLRASHSGAAFLTSDSIDSGAFDITAGPPGQLVVTRQPIDTAAGENILIEVSAQDQFGNPVTQASVDVTLDAAVNPGGWPLLVDTSLTKPTVNGVASWAAADRLRINRAVGDYQLSGSGLGAPVLTDAFDITPGAPARLIFTQQPVDTFAGEDLLVAVTAKDQFDNTVTDSGVEVTLSLGTNPGQAALLASGGLSKTTTNGIATWNAVDDLHIDVSASGYRLAASGVGSAATSDAFDIVAGSPDHLVITQQPVSTPAGEDILIAVEIQDAFNNVTAATGIPITLSLAANPGNDELLASSGLTKNSVNGIAEWNAADDLRLTAAAEDYRISVSGVGSPVTSDAFDIIAPPADEPPVAPPPAFCGAGAVSSITPLLLVLMLLRRPSRCGQAG